MILEKTELLRIKLHDLFRFIFYMVIMVSEKDLGIESVLDFASICFLSYN